MQANWKKTKTNNRADSERFYPVTNVNWSFSISPFFQLKYVLTLKTKINE